MYTIYVTLIILKGLYANVAPPLNIKRANVDPNPL